MDAVETLVHQLCHDHTTSHAHRLKHSLLTFFAQYNFHQSQLCRRLRLLQLTHQRYKAVIHAVERDLRRFQHMIDWWVSSTCPPTEACLARVHDANRARLAILSTHKRHADHARRACESQLKHDALVAQRFVTAATLTHIDLLCDAADKMRRPRLAWKLRAISVAVQSGYSHELLVYFIDVWRRHHTELQVDEPRGRCVTPVLAESGDDDVASDSVQLPAAKRRCLFACPRASDKPDRKIIMDAAAVCV